MIENITIKNFKSLKNISIKTKSLNLLMGLNGMGKSSLLQSLLLLKQSNNLYSRILSLNGSLINFGVIEKSILVKSIIMQLKMQLL